MLVVLKRIGLGLAAIAFGTPSIEFTLAELGRFGSDWFVMVNLTAAVSVLLGLWAMLWIRWYKAKPAKAKALREFLLVVLIARFVAGTLIAASQVISGFMEDLIGAVALLAIIVACCATYLFFRTIFPTSAETVES